MSTSPAELTKIANRLRLDALEMISKANSGHPGGSLSVIDILTALYFGGFVQHDPKNPNDPTRDHVILSKAHASAALYAVLGERGFFDKKEFMHFRQVDALLQGHPNQHVPGVEVAGGSLGQGLSISVGLALAARLDKTTQHTFVILGDGELQEGQIWEAAMSAAHYKLGNLTAIVDHNKLQIDGANTDVMHVEPIEDKFRAFGWKVETIDGHDLTAIVAAFEYAKAPREQPLVIVAETVKGKGAPMAENNYGYHGVALTPAELETTRAFLMPKC